MFGIGRGIVLIAVAIVAVVFANAVYVWRRGARKGDPGA